MSQRDEDDRFRPRPGKPRNGKSGRRFTSQVLQAAQKAAGGVRPRFAGSAGRKAANGRGRTVARLLAGGGGRRDRRVMVKARLVVLAKAAPGSTAAHLRYIQREGVTPQGEPGRAYGALTDEADSSAFEQRGRGDRHQFRFIVSPEDATELGDLKDFTRTLMEKMAADLGTRLDWVAIDHFDTDHPHSHIVLRGVDDRGRDLMIARDYIAHGLRARAAGIATERLGPQTEQELRDRLVREIDAERWTGLDHHLTRQARDGVIDLDGAPAALRSRVQTLERLGLAQRDRGGSWRLREDLEPTLRAMGERGDIVRALQRAFDGEPRPLEVLHENAEPRTVIGRVAGKGLADELTDRGYLVVDGIDGKGRYIALPPDTDLRAYPLGTIVQARSNPAAPRASDRTIASIAEAGIYSPDRHLALAEGEDPEGFVSAHVRRLEALRRAGVVQRLDPGRWRLPPDFLDRAATYEAGRFGAVRIEVVGDGSPARQARVLGATWLDRTLIEDTRPGRTGFGAETARALDERRAFLAEQGLAERRGEGWRLATGLLATLRGRELASEGARLTSETGLKHRAISDGDVVRGTYRRSLNLVSGRFAMIDDGLGFSLVPWRPVLEHRLGQSVSGLVKAGSVQWTLGRNVGV